MCTNVTEIWADMHRLPRPLFMHVHTLIHKTANAKPTVNPKQVGAVKAEVVAEAGAVDQPPVEGEVE